MYTSTTSVTFYHFFINKHIIILTKRINKSFMKTVVTSADQQWKSSFADTFKNYVFETFQLSIVYSFAKKKIKSIKLKTILSELTNTITAITTTITIINIPPQISKPLLSLPPQPPSPPPPPSPSLPSPPSLPQLSLHHHHYDNQRQHHYHHQIQLQYTSKKDI